MWTFTDMNNNGYLTCLKLYISHTAKFWKTYVTGENLSVSYVENLIFQHIYDLGYTISMSGNYILVAVSITEV